MSLSPLGLEPEPGGRYFDSFFELAERIRKGASFSGRERNCAFLNLGGQSFADASAALGLDLEQDSRGIALCDWDHDGDVDLWLTNRTAPRLQLLRNETAAASGGARSVAFFLVGDVSQGCPMDAAGARVVLSAGGSERLQTVHLGDGFLSQSSRWLQFGLGTEQQIDQVVVHWPAGEPERFEGARAGARFVLRQGTGIAVASGGERPATVEIKRMSLPEPTEVSRVWLSEPVALPADLKIPDLAAGPAVLNLWASWCAPCIAELEAFGAADDLPVMPINIENVDGDEAISSRRAKEILRSAGIEQKPAFADPTLIAALNQAVNERIYRHHNLPLPASFLIDGERRIRAIYKGTVEVDQLRADLQLLGDPQLDPRMAAAPMLGRWANEQFASHPIAVAATFASGGYLADARDYLVRSLANLGGDDAAGKLRLAEVYMKIADLDRGQGKHESAVSNYRRALKENPSLVPARIFLTLSLAELGQAEEALALVEAQKRGAPGNPNFINLEADVQRALGEDAKSVAAYRAVLAINRRYIPAIEGLASILASSRDPAVRDGAAAVEMARQLNQVPGMTRDPQLLNVAADAFAAGNRFGPALDLAERALGVLLPYGEESEIRQQRDRIASLRSNQPYQPGESDD